MLPRRMDRGAITVRGLRSTFGDWAGESTAFPGEVVEHAMAHQRADKAEAAAASALGRARPWARHRAR